MKNIFNIGVRSLTGALLAAFFSACSTPEGSQDLNSATSKTGTLEIRLDAVNQAARAILGPSQGSGLANAYEVIILNEGFFKTVALPGGRVSSVPVPEGSYRLLAFAGYKKSETSATCLLLGSAFGSDPAVIQEGLRTTVDLVLKPVDFTFSAISPVTAGGSVSVHAAGDSRNPYVGMALSGASTSERPRLRSTAFWNGYHDFTNVTGPENAWTADLLLPGPALPAVLDFQFQGSAVFLKDCGAYTGSLAGRTAFNWKWLNRFDMAESGPLNPLVEGAVSVVSAATGLNLGLSWEEGS